MTNRHRGSFGLGSLRALVLFGMTLLLLPAALYGAEKKERKTVRIAYQEFNRQMIVDKNNKPVSGYAYDYIQTISAYAGWDVEFVPCSSFYDSVVLLRAGKVDMIYEISYTEERTKEMLFPNEPMGYEYYYLYSSSGNTSIAPDDFKSLNGKTVGVTSGTILTDLLNQWSKKHNVTFKIVEYEDISKKEADLYAGKIDLDLELSMLAKSNLSAVEKIGASAYYLVASSKRPDLIDDLNAAVEKVLNNDLYYFTRLQERYFSDTVLSRNLSIEEKNWLEEHKVLRVGYLANYLPFSAKDKKGRPVGAGIDTVRAILKTLNLEDQLKVEFVCFDNQKDGYKAVESGKIDLMVPAYVSNSVKKDYAVIESKRLVTLAINLAYLKGLGQDAAKRIGVNRNNLMQYYYCRDSYPNSEIVFYDDIGGCLDGLLNRTSDGTFLNGLRTDALLKPGKYHAIRRVRAKDDFVLRMAFAKDNIGLMLLMNRGLTMLDPDFVNKASYAHIGQMYSYSVTDFIMEHLRLAIFSIAVLVALTVALIGYQISNRKLAGMNRKLREHSETIEKQRQQLEEKQFELKAALQMAESANHAKTTFLSNMSHDIRTPMNAIVGFTSLAANHLHETELVRDYLATIMQASEHLLSLINDVLDMSRIESGKMTLNEKEESLADIIHVIRGIVYADTRAKQLDFRIDAADIRNEFVRCDRLRLNQVLLNLLSNAVKYTPEGGAISLRIAQKPSAKAGRGTFEFRVRVNGIGMSEEFVKTIFEPFSREKDSAVADIQGTGLGMAITKSIVDMMGGSISLTSKKGVGTEFVVRADFKIADNPTPYPATPELDGARALVVNGDAGACRNIADMLRELGMRGEGCASWQEALGKAEEALRGGDPFKVCVVDRPLPDIDGADAVRRIREAVGKDAFIIVADDRNDTENAVAVVFVPRPVFKSNLQKALLKLCGKAIPERTDREDPAAALKGKKILLVDDSELNLKIGVLLLKEHGMIVDTARNGKIAVDTIKEKGIDAYDFIVMDIQMPVMDGYEATGLLRKLPGGDKLKIIAFSANAFEEDREKSLKAGMDGHITKPLKINDLLSALNKFVG